MEKKKHIIYDHPYFGALVAGILTYAFATLPAVFPAAILGIYQSLNGGAEVPANISKMVETSMFLVSGLLALVAIAIHKGWFKKDGYKGCFTLSKAPKKDVWKCILVLFIVDMMVTIIEIMTKDVVGPRFVLPTLSSLILAFYAGVFEETSFRAIPISIIMKNSPTRKRMWIGVIATALAFGFMHMGNITSGATAYISLLQSLTAICSGLFWAAVYLRTGTILIPMAYHVMHDFIGFMDAEQSTGTMAMTTVPVASIVGETLLAVVCIVGAIYLLRKSKWEEIKATWSDIWAE